MDNQEQHTLWLWMEGVFARRISYFLLMKGLVASTAELLAGRSTATNLSIIRTYPLPPLKWESEDPNDPPPKHATNPCMRTTNRVTGMSKFVYESTSILLYLEELYPNPPMQPTSLIGRAHMLDMIGQINLISIDTNYFLRNTVPEHGMIMGLNHEDQSRTAALNAKFQEMHGFLKLQTWAQNNGLQSTGWLTPDVDGPGLVDLALVPNLRFVELVYGIDTLEDNALKPLAEWYKRFKTLSWWSEYEEREGILPEMLSFGKTSRAPWVSIEGFN